jgi:hypothetical protein
MRAFGGQQTVPFQESMDDIHYWDLGDVQEAIGIGIERVGRLLLERPMTSGFTTAYQNLQSLLQGAEQTLRNLCQQGLSSTVIVNAMAPILQGLRYSWINIAANLGTTPNIIETVTAGVPPSSSNTYRVLPSSGPQRPRQRIQAPPPPPPVASPPAPPAEQGYGWMHHMNHVLEYIWDNKLYIAGGVLAGLTLGGVGAVAGIVCVETGLIGGLVAGGSVNAVELAQQQCVRCRRGECTPEQHAHRD